MRRALLIWFSLSGVALAVFALAMASGSNWLAPTELLRALFGPADSIEYEIVMGLRLPRALAAFGAGGLLALSGALMQILLRNPLADPYVLGLSGGAAVGATAFGLFAFRIGHGRESFGCWARRLKRSIKKNKGRG